MSVLNLSKYARLFALSYFFATAIFLSTFENLIDRQSNPIGADFLAFWSAGHLANEGKPENSYQPGQIYNTSLTAIPENKKKYVWSYPPPFLLVTQALARLPYLTSLIIWSLAGLCCYFFAIYKLNPVRDSLWLSAGFLPAFVNFLQGQNGFVSTALFAGAAFNLTRRPLVAGVFIGLLSYKPQLGLIIPLALLAGRHFLAFTSASITVLSLNLLSIHAFGLKTYQKFLYNLKYAHTLIDDGNLPLYKMSSFFATMRFLGIDSTIALSAHIIIGLIVTLITVDIWRKSLSMDLKISVLVFGSLIVPHHLNDYDLTLLIIPIALLAKNNIYKALSHNQTFFLSFVWFSPILIVLGYSILSIQLGPVLIFFFFLYSAWRCYFLTPSTYISNE